MRWRIDHRDCCRGPLSGTRTWRTFGSPLCNPNVRHVRVPDNGPRQQSLTRTWRTFGSPLCNPFDDFVGLLAYASGQLKPLQRTPDGYQDMNVLGHGVSSFL